MKKHLIYMPGDISAHDEFCFCLMLKGYIAK